MILRLVISVWMVMVALVGSVIIYGHVFSEPNDLQQLGFDTCNGTPCFMGMSLGMAWDDAKNLLDPRQDDIYSSEAGQMISVDVNPTDLIGVAVRSDEMSQSVEEIDFMLWDEQPHPHLASAIALYGAPCGVKIYFIESMIERVWVIYPNISINVSSLSPNSEIDALALSNMYSDNFCKDVKKNDGLVTNSWRGFRKFSYYLTER